MLQPSWCLVISIAEPIPPPNYMPWSPSAAWSGRAQREPEWHSDCALFLMADIFTSILSNVHHFLGQQMTRSTRGETYLRCKEERGEHQCARVCLGGPVHQDLFGRQNLIDWMFALQLGGQEERGQAARSLSLGSASCQRASLTLRCFERLDDSPCSTVCMNLYLRNSTCSEKTMWQCGSSQGRLQAHHTPSSIGFEKQSKSKHGNLKKTLHKCIAWHNYIFWLVSSPLP